MILSGFKVAWPLYGGAIFLDKHHKRKLKEEFGKILFFSLFVLNFS